MGEHKKKKRQRELEADDSQHSSNDIKRRKNTVIFRTNEETNSYVASFPSSGKPSADDLEFGLFQHSKKNRRIIVSAKNPEVHYEGRNFGGSNDQKLCRYLVFKYDKKTHTATLMNKNEDGQQPFEIHNSIRNLPKPNTNMLDNEIDEQQVDSLEELEKAQYLRRTDRRNALVETFGSMRRKKARDNYELNQIDQVASSKAAVSIMKKSAEQSQQMKNLANESADIAAKRLILPEFDIHASEPKDIYDENSLMNPEIRRSFSEETKQYSKSIRRSTVVMESPSLFINGFLKDIPSKSEKSVLKHKLRFLLYWQCLFKFYKLPSFKLASDGLPEMLGGSELVGDMLIETYSEKDPNSANGRVKTQRNLDRLTLAMFAICLTISDFQISAEKLSLLANDFGKPVTWIIKYFLELGCKQRVDPAQKASKLKGGDKMVLLTVPLSFPQPHKKARK